MNVMTNVEAVAPEGFSEEEWKVRVDLAACYRLVAMFGWDDLLATHISARVPGMDDCFLINPLGVFFEEMTASALVRIDREGNPLTPAPDGVNRAAFVIHGAIHDVRHDAGCIIHLHTKDGVAVSCMADGLLPLNQTALLVEGDMAFHDYEGVAFNMDERERLQTDLGTHSFMLLRNHGTLALGSSVAEAFTRMHAFETACTIQVRALSQGRPTYPVDPAAQDRTREIGRGMGGYADIAWRALIRKLDRVMPGYAQ